MSSKNLYISAAFVLVLIGLYIYIFAGPDTGRSVNPSIVSENTKKSTNEESETSVSAQSDSDEIVPIDTIALPPDHDASVSTRQIRIAESVLLPLAGSAPVENVKYSIPVEEIRRGCFRQDCIPAVDNPVFDNTKVVDEILEDASIGLALSYKGVNRFYSFNMLVTREIVNDVVAGDPLLISYCPLCGTGIVFERLVNGEVQEFGVSGMLWQSNLLMYNRAESLQDRNIWSQALGEAVVGNDTGTKLTIIPSDIMRYGEWKEKNPTGEVLNTGSVNDPYNGNYYGVAKNFSPDFDEANSPLDPSEYVYGIEVDGAFKAYTKRDLPVGVTKDAIGNTSVVITRGADGKVIFENGTGDSITDTEGFWFSWVAIHPETLLWEK